MGVWIVWNLEVLASGSQSTHKLIPHIICQFLYAREKTLNEDLFCKGSSANLPRLHMCENKVPFWDFSEFAVTIARTMKISSALVLIVELIKTLYNTRRLRRKMVKKKIQKSKEPEHHLTFTREIDTESRYPTHRDIPNWNSSRGCC